MIEIKTDNKYDIIYLDPPWQYGGSGGTKWLPASEYYDTMPLQELFDMKDQITKISKDNCLMFMWCCGPTLDDAIALGKHWGFDYITMAFVWYKQRSNVGNYTMSSCEFVLLFKKGKIPNDRVRNPGTLQFLSCPIGNHSKKPYEIRNRISKMFPTSRKIELFSRDICDGWDCWGNGVNSDNSVLTAKNINEHMSLSKKNFLV